MHHALPAFTLRVAPRSDWRSITGLDCASSCSFALAATPLRTKWRCPRCPLRPVAARVLYSADPYSEVLICLQCKQLFQFVPHRRYNQQLVRFGVHRNIELRAQADRITQQYHDVDLRELADHIFSAS